MCFHDLLFKNLPSIFNNLNTNINLINDCCLLFFNNVIIINKSNYTATGQCSLQIYK